MIDTRTAPYAALTLRVALGTLLVAHALLKLFVFTLPGTVQFFQSLGLPSALAYVTVGAELVGGVLLILGVGNGWLFSAPNGGWEYPAFWTVTLIVQALLGDGAYALGNRIAGRPASRLQTA